MCVYIYICNYWVISINWHNAHFLVPGMVLQSHLWVQFLKWVTSQIAVLTPPSIIRCWTWVAEPVPKASQYQPDLSHYFPAPPNYRWQPFRAHPYYKAPWCIRMPQGTNSTWLERARNCNYIPHYNRTQVQFQFKYNNRAWACNDSDLETSWTCSNESAITKDIFDSLDLWNLTWNANNMSCQRYYNFTYPKSTCCSSWSNG